MSRILLSLWWVVIGACGSSCGAAPRPAAAGDAPAVPSPPHIVLFFIDDMGWSDVGYRGADFETPNIDALQHASLEFTRAYIPTPTCSPSRATLLTGQHPARLKFVRHIPNDAKHGFDKFRRTDQPWNLWATDPAQVPSRNWLPLELTTYAEALGGLGYYNQFVGKWHLGHEPYHPVKQGFDAQFGTSNAGHPQSYHPPYFKHSQVLADETDRYLTDRLTDASVDFIANYDRDQPFMLSFWYYTVHGPHDGREDLVKHFEAKGLTGRRAQFAAMVAALDASVGRVRDALVQRGIEQETLVIFLSDQGGMFDNAPLRGGKRADTLYEGGARVPMLVHWPGVTAPGTATEVPVQSTDLFSTLVEVAGGDPADHGPSDGVSLLPLIRGGAAPQRDGPLIGYRAYENLYASVREDGWKLMAHRDGTLKLFHLPGDPSEARDVAAEHPARVAALKAKLAAWERAVGVEQYSGVQSSDTPPAP